MTENAIEKLNQIERPTDNPDEAQNDMNFMQKVDVVMLLLKMKGEVEQSDYQIIRDQSINQAPRLAFLRDNLNNLEA